LHTTSQCACREREDITVTVHRGKREEGGGGGGRREGEAKTGETGGEVGGGGGRGERRAGGSGDRRAGKGE